MPVTRDARSETLLQYAEYVVGDGVGARVPGALEGETAAHGGTWRCAWSVDSIGRASYVAGMLWG